MSETTSVIVGGARTPIARLTQSLSSLSGSDLGRIAGKFASQTPGPPAPD